MNLRHYDLHLEIFTPVAAIINRDSNSWNLDVISLSIPLEARQAVITTQFGSASDHDRQLWAHSSLGEYSVKSGYAVQIASMRLAHEFLLIPQKLYKSLASPILNPDGVVHYWINPKLGMIKINTDAAWNKDSAECGLAAVARNSLGKIVGGMHNYGSSISVMAVEALAIKLGLSLASSLSLSSFQLESDSLVLVSSLSNHLYTVDWTAARSIDWIRENLNLFLQVNWRWVSRKANEAADWVASLALRRVCPLDWVSSPPSSLMRILLFDVVSPPP
ncbi:hypothetical protein ACLB2K_077470 [Fragaria x ananassa]